MARPCRSLNMGKRVCVCFHSYRSCLATAKRVKPYCEPNRHQAPLPGSENQSTDRPDGPADPEQSEGTRTPTAWQTGLGPSTEDGACPSGRGRGSSALLQRATTTQRPIMFPLRVSPPHGGTSRLLMQRSYQTKSVPDPP